MDALYRKIVQQCALMPEDYEEIFQRPNAEELVKTAIVCGHHFDYGYEDKFLLLPHPEEVVKLFLLRGHGLQTKLQNAMFDFSNAEELLEIYLLNENSLSLENELRLLDLPYGKKLISLIVELSFLEKETERRAKEKGWI